MAGARVVQITDTHFSSERGTPHQWLPVVEWLHDDPPDLMVHTGDIVLEDPDDVADREFAAQLLAQIRVPYVVIPGNHDIGFYGEDADRPSRLAAFRATWGDDRFVRDLGGWRLVGIDAYLLGTREHDDWVRAAVATDRPVLVFVHQPVADEPADGWEMPVPARGAFERAIDGADVRVVASGHRHCWLRAGRALWAPSLTLTSDDPVAGADPRPGLVEHLLSPTGHHTHRVLRPWDMPRRLDRTVTDVA